MLSRWILIFGVLALSGLAPTLAQDDDEQLGAFQRSPIRPVLENERALSPDEPMYFVVGGADDEERHVEARFQLSFKYRIFDPGSFLGRNIGAARNLYFAYTQTSLWNLSEDSAPFEDTTYRPSVFWQELTDGRGLRPDAWRAGFEHVSNGQADDESRSFNTVFLRTMWWAELWGRELVLAPKLAAYIEKSDNEDIDDYRGHLALRLRYGRETSWLLDAELRGVDTDRGSIELNLSYPIRAPLFYRAGGFIYLQYFQGHGESLLNYHTRTKPTVRIGFAIVR